MKHDVAAFSNRFWSIHMPKLKRFDKPGEADRAIHVKTEHKRKIVRKALDATEGYVFCGTVATGLLQMLSLVFDNNEMEKSHYKRTPSKKVASEATVAHYLRKFYFLLLERDRNLPICKIIREKIDADGCLYEKYEAG
jgi:hypothetical protein